MSTAQVQRLEGLLDRIQKNRLVERQVTAAVSAPTASAQRIEVAAAVGSVELPKPPSPLEHAIEAKVAAPAIAAQPVVSMKPVPVGIPAVAKPQPAPKPVAELVPARAVSVAKSSVDPNAPARVVTSPAPPSAPIAATASPHPTMDGPSFGELLRRSLALRPR